MDRLNQVSSQLNSQDYFAHLSMAPPDPILGTALAYKADKDPKKMNLGVGAYRDNNEKPIVFSVVKRVCKEMAFDNKLDKEYLPIDGSATFNKLSKELIFGSTHEAVKSGRIVTAQTISGTGSLRVAFEFIAKYMNKPDILVSAPTWGNHHSIIQDSGLKYIDYPYYEPKTRGFDFTGMINKLKTAKAGSVVLLHSCAHNPTGVDPNPAQWTEIAKVIQQQQLFPLFDSAYQGFASGDLINDAKSIRLFLDLGFQMIVTQSYAKNMGLYGERIGAIHFVCSSKQTAEKVLSQLKLVIRPMYSSPPMNGSRIVEQILSSKENFDEWDKELKQVSYRIIDMRKLLRNKLEELKVPGTWQHITDQIGMFSYTGLTKEQCEILINKFHIYLLKNGRISMCGITTNNVDHLANAILDAVTSTMKK